MIQAAAKLIYRRNRQENGVSTSFCLRLFSLLKNELVSLKSLLLIPILFVSLLCPTPRAESKTAQNELNKDTDLSFAHIVISSGDYARAARLRQQKQEQGSHGKRLTLPELARETMSRYFSHPSQNKSAEKASTGLTGNWLNETTVAPEFLKRTGGVFVTLSKNGKTRACWGSVYPREANVARETVISTLGALSKDYRFKPINAAELKDLKIQVTVVCGLDPITDIKVIDPLKYGVMVRSAGRGGVILPGEAVDAYYEFVLARLKAGIKPDEPCQIYRIRTEIYD